MTTKEEIFQKLISIGSLKNYPKSEKKYYALFTKEILEDDMNFIINNCNIIRIVPNCKNNGININFTLKS